MNPNRLKVMLGVAGVLMALVIWKWIAGWGLITIHAQSEPLSKVIRSIERQGGIKVVTNADTTQPVFLDLDRVPPAEAMDSLAARLDANWSVGYVAGPSKTDVISAISSLSQGQRDRSFRMFGFGGGFGGGMLEVSSTPVDARRVVWKVSPSDEPQLQSYLDQLSQKTGLMAMVPETWNPPLAKAPSGGKAASAMRDMIKSVKGDYQEVFIIRVNQERVADGGRPPEADRASRGGDGGFGGRGNFHPEWIAERAEARIEQLPKEEREQARKDFGEMRAFFQQMRALPDDQRRAAMQAYFDQPGVQEKMAERMADRDEKSGPDRRADRSRRYIERKAQAKGKNSS